VTTGYYSNFKTLHRVTVPAKTVVIGTSSINHAMLTQNARIFRYETLSIDKETPPVIA